MVIRSITFTLIIFSFLAIVSYGGEISQNLVSKISTFSPDDKIAVIIALDNPTSSASLKSGPAVNYKTRAERHKYGIISLQQKALLAQSGLINHLNQMKAGSLVDDIKSHWIINAVTAEIALSEIQNLADRDDVALIFAVPQLRSLTPMAVTQDYSPADLSAVFVEPNLRYIGADSAWALGYTGAGRIVCSFDTGVEGNHPALYDSWKGHDGDSAAAWYDPMGGESFPHVFAPYQVGNNFVFHGTQSMGIILGYDSANEHFSGVAPDARWISAATVNLWGASYIDAFEWACDPDGDPNTIDDIPDVINHSWGFENDDLDCDDYFYQVIDNTEALGIINIFSAGNSGPSTTSIVNPANRARDSLDCFAIGSIDYRVDSLSYFSSIGPSDCDDISIKPNVVAPGQFIHTTFGSSNYIWVNGTSFSAPHVSGAVAILRQYAPDATVDEIKTALLASCKSFPGWGQLPNNEFGYGMIYIPAALEALAPLSTPDLFIYRFDYGTVAPGESIMASVVIQNRGGLLDEVYGLISSADGLLNFTADSLSFGTLNLLDTALSHIEFSATVVDTVTPGTIIELDFALSGSGGYNKIITLTIQVGEKPKKEFYTHRNGKLRFTVSNFGQYGFSYGSFNPLGYDGFKYLDSTSNELFEAAFLIGTDSNHVSDGVRTIAEEPDNDFSVAPGGDMIINMPGHAADQETFSIFNDSRAENPIGLEITQRSYSWDNPPDDNFVILQYLIRNLSDTAIYNLYAGLFFDWNLNPSFLDAAGYDSANNLGYIMHPEIIINDIAAKYRGIAVLNEEGVTTHKLHMTYVNMPDYSLTEADKYLFLSENIFDSFNYTWYNQAQTLSTGPFDLLPGQIDTALFAIVAADSSLENLINAAAGAKAKFQTTTDIASDEVRILPRDFTLEQNYPNPFNPTTTISFALKSRSEVTLSIYNILGEKVTDLLSHEFPAGAHEINWNGRDYKNSEVASGVYFYRLTAGGQSLTKKMILLK